MKECRFNEDYYERGIEKGISGYENYRWLPDLTLNMCKSIVTELDIKKTETILDFGCAKGFVVQALRELGFDSYGCDISKYAVESSHEEVKSFLTLQKNLEQPLGNNAFYDWIFSKDVLEHIPYDSLGTIIASFKKHTDSIFIVVPLGDGKNYIVPEYENDITHIIREDKGWWFQKFIDAGFKNLKASYTFQNVKENWWSKYPRGNLFIYTER